MNKSKHNEEFVYEGVRCGAIEIDSCGRVWRIKNRNRHNENLLLVQRHRCESFVDSLKNRLSVVWGRRNRKVSCVASRLVWYHLHGHIPGDLTINHIDGNPLNNNPNNLELANHSEQMAHAYMVLNRKKVRCFGEKNGCAKLKKCEIDEIIKIRKTGTTTKIIGKMFKVASAHISNICNGKRWRDSRGVLRLVERA